MYGQGVHLPEMIERWSAHFSRYFYCSFHTFGYISGISSNLYFSFIPDVFHGHLVLTC